MGHRRFLSHDHKWRNEKKTFDGTKENRLAPKTLSGDEVLQQLNQMKQVIFGKVNKKRKRSQQKICYLNWRKHSIFFNLPYWHTMLIRHNLNVMHVEKNIGDNLIGTLMNIDGKSKDNLNARKDLMAMGLRKELHLIPIQGKEIDIQNSVQTIGNSKPYKMPSAFYTLSKDERQLFCQFLMDLKLPDGFSSNISRCVNKHEGKLQNLKSHDIHCLLHRHLPLGICGLLRKDISNTLIEFSAYFRELCSKSLRMSDLERLENSITLTLCKLERIFPPTFFDIMVHLSIHLATEAKIAGPVQYRWMYPFERYLRTLKSYVRNKAHPEGSIAKGIIAQECVTFCSKYLHDVETRLNRVGRNYEGDLTQKSSSLAIFSQCGLPLGNSKTEQLAISDWNRAAMCVLQNCEEVSPYVREHIKEIESKYDSDVELQHEEQFLGWFQDKIAEIFHTKKHEKYLKTQNSGVFVRGDDDLSNKEYYGLVLDIIELQYQGSKKIALFKSHWWDVYNCGRGYKEDENGFFLVNVDRELATNTTDPYILASQAQRVYYAKDIRDPKWLVVVKTQPRDLYDVPTIERSANDQEESTSTPIQENENIGDFYRIDGDKDHDDLCTVELARANVEEIVFDLSELNINVETNEEDLLNCNDDDNDSFENKT
ncbi:uncharacterized protein LOC109713253 [Ananas comosus]|uniref:Uncharacterized protein LOC109713253 n=1 Tax=Ananas comosus TaxID=4615 RepID=A0A6P5FB65_ANACO|nr:uncharacterized protein LOC109713253 [Ananas comosus]